MGGHPEGMHLVLERTEGLISSEAVESRGIEKAMPEELCVTLSDKKGCFACNERSHDLEQCKIKYKLVSAARQFGYATKFPFTIIQPSDAMIEKKKFYHHCVIIKSNVTNLDKHILKDELKMFWKLSGDWELRRECSMTFLASFSSEDDVMSCLKNPKIETLLDNKEVKLTVTRWNENDDGSLDLVEDWLLVSGVPRIYRNWKELYEVASAFGVLIDVDEESLEVGDKEPIRLKTAFRSFVGAPFSYSYASGWSSKLVVVTAVQDKTEGVKHKSKEIEREHKKELNTAKSILLEEPKGIEESRSNGKAKENKVCAPTVTIINSEITAAESSKPEGVQSVAQSSQSMVGEENGKAKENKISAPAVTITNSEITAAESSKLGGVQSIAQSPRSMIGEENGKAKENKISATTATITNSEITAAESSKLEGVQSIAQSPQSMIGEENRKAKEKKISAPAATITNSEITTVESLKSEGVQSIAHPQSMIGEENFRGIPKPPIKHVFKRRGKKQQVTEAINKNSSNKMDKEVAPHSSSNATRTDASSGCYMLDQKDCSKMEPNRVLNMEEITSVGESKNQLGACRDTEYNNVAASTIKSKKTQTLGDTSRTLRDELITKHTKGVGIDQMGPRVQAHKKKDASSKVDTRLLPNSEEVCIYGSFSEMGLHENLLKGIYKYGLKKPSAVHQRGIVPLCKGFGVVHRSFSGTTETICSGVLQRLDYGSAECQALILVPTPGLAQETEKVLKELGQFLGVTAQTCTGGTSAHADQQTMSRRVQVLVGTPDCILDMLQRHALSPDNIRMLFLDEADELLTGGSKDQIYNIILHLPNKIQVGLFSANFSNEVLQTSRRFMGKRVAVIVPRDEELKNVKHYYMAVENEKVKLGKVYALFKTTRAELLVIFVNTQDKAVSLAEALGKHYTVSASHGGMDQRARDTAIQKFKSGSSRVLIASDHRGVLIATDHRGTNAMQQVPITINYDLPTEPMRYVRRLQQLNRQFRNTSMGINLVTPADGRTLSAITRFCNCKMGELPPDM